MYIAEASQAVGRSMDTLRRWEDEQLVVPDRDSRGRRVYREHHIARCRELARHALDAMKTNRKLAKLVPAQLSLFGPEE